MSNSDVATLAWIVAICSQKGGVGKSMLAMAIAAAVADSSGRALIADVDPQGSTVEAVEDMPDAGFDVIHELDPRNLARLSQVRGIDMIIVDAPGSLEGHDVLKEVAEAAHFGLIPHTDEPSSRTPTTRTAALLEAAGVPHAAVINRVDPRAGGNAVIKAREDLDERGIPYFKSFIRQYAGYPNSLDAGKTVYQWRKQYGANMREDISRVNAELQRRLGQIGTRG